MYRHWVDARRKRTISLSFLSEELNRIILLSVIMRGGPK
jgi:hypothetical protein